MIKGKCKSKFIDWKYMRVYKKILKFITFKIIIKKLRDYFLYQVEEI